MIWAVMYPLQKEPEMLRLTGWYACVWEGNNGEQAVTRTFSGFRALTAVTSRHFKMEASSFRMDGS